MRSKIAQNHRLLLRLQSFLAIVNLKRSANCSILDSRLERQALKKEKMADIFKIIQIILAVILIAFILLQQRGSGLGMAFGGEGNVYRSRRGVEKFLFMATIVVAVLFCITALATVFFA